VRTGLTVIAYITAKAGHEDKVREALLDLVAQTREENACVNYDLHQPPKNHLTSAPDLKLHAKSAHLQSFTKVAGNLSKGPAEIRKWSMISELGDTGSGR